MKGHKPICHVVAGPNGSGKSTFALDYLPEYAGSLMQGELPKCGRS